MSPSRRRWTGPSTARCCRAAGSSRPAQYRLAGGGRLAITYRGPGGARFTLDEGAWCPTSPAAPRPGRISALAAFGDREGTLMATDTGSFAIAVDAGSTVSWQLVGDALDESTVRMFGAALIAVGG